MSGADLAPTLGWEVIDWIETELAHGPGDVEGKPIVLDDEFQRFCLQAYELRPAEVCRCGEPLGGLVLVEYPWCCPSCDERTEVRRRFNRVVLSRPKGWSKSEKAGMLCCVEGLGPVRFGGWDANGEPVAVSLRDLGATPEILCVATEEGQADNTYSNVAYMLSHGAVVDDYPGIDIGREWETSTRTLLPGGGSIEPVTAGANSKDGGKSTFVTIDEPHLMYTEPLRRLVATIRRNLAKRKLADPWSLETTTMYRPGQGSVAEASHEYAQAIAAGRVKDPRLLFDHRQASKGLGEIGDDDLALLAALTEAYGQASQWMDLHRVIAEIRDPNNDLADSERYFLNREVTASDSWIGKADWDDRARPDLVVAPKTKITVGFDGSQYDDATALIGCTLEGAHLFTIGIWERPEGSEGEDWVVPRGEVKRAMWAVFKTHRVIRFYGDPPYWQDELDELAARFGDKVVVSWWTNRDKPMAEALERLHTAIVTDAVTQDGNPQFAAHVLNARKHVKRAADDPEGKKERILVRKPAPRSRLKIDCLPAATLAFEARADAVAGGALNKRVARKAQFTSY